MTLGAIGTGVGARFSGAAAAAALTQRIRVEYGVPDVALLDSGTSALALAFRAAAAPGSRPRVALPAWGCYDLMTAADAVDAEVSLYDLDPATLSPDPGSLERAAAHGLDAIVVAHWYGIPADLAPARHLAGRIGALLIEDAAQGVGTTIGGRPAGSTGDFGVLSFGRGKGRTGGHGGALLAGTPDAAARLRAATESLSAAPARVRDHLALLAQWLLGRPLLYGIPASIPSLRLGETLYRSPSPIRLIAPASAAVVSSVWDRSALEVAVRRGNAGLWREALGSAEELRMYATPAGTESGWLRFPVRATGKSREVLAGNRSRHQGVMPGYPQPLDRLPVSSSRLRGVGQCAGAAELCRDLYTFPSHAFLRSDNMRVMRGLLAVS